MRHNQNVSVKNIDHKNYIMQIWSFIFYKNLATANRLRVSCAHNTSRA